MTTLDQYNAIGRDIIGAAFEVKSNTGRGLREKYYEAALAYELRQKGYNVQTQVALPALYKGTAVEDSFLADIIVDNKVIIELKAISQMGEVECRQLLTYLKVSDYKLGYLINFGAKDFKTGSTDERLPYKYGIYRFVNKL